MMSARSIPQAKLSRIPLLSVACLPNHEGNSPSRYREFSRSKTLFPSISGIELGQGKRKHMRIFYAPIFLRRQASNSDTRIIGFSPMKINGRVHVNPTGVPDQANFLLACLLSCYIGASIFRQNSIFTEKSCCFPTNHRSREIIFRSTQTSNIIRQIHLSKHIDTIRYLMK